MYYAFHILFGQLSCDIIVLFVALAGGMFSKLTKPNGKWFWQLVAHKQGISVDGHSSVS